MKKRYILIFIILPILAFAIGSYVWRVNHSGRLPDIDFLLSSEPKEAAPDGDTVLAMIAGQEILQSDLDFEYNAHTEGVFDNSELKPEIELGKHLYERELKSLRQRLMATIVERKMMYEFIKRDQRFTLDDPTRYEKCEAEWKKAVLNLEAKFLNSTKSRKLLRERICESNLIEQYLNELVYPLISVTDDEIAKYYEENTEEFYEPTKVIIRNIVLGSEREAKRVRYKLTASNFAETARRHSITPEASKGGLMGPFARGELPRVFDVAFSMRRREIRSILKSIYGFHLIMLEKKIKKHQLELDEVKGRIRLKIMENRRREAYKQTLETALNDIEIKSDQKLW
ncbi:peptidyl-prolyl cis-trans isomerase [Oligoflexaceae bacterium]|nr:peptidyl-prolyl cis-trans isomerase [Oligoflexaceae bacterium]